MPYRRLFFAIALSCAPAILLAQGQPGAPPGTPGAVLADADPIGFLLEHRDSLRLVDSQVTRLVRLNLGFFRRKRAIQMRLDSILPDGPTSAMGRQRVSPPGQDSATDSRARPLFEQLREVIRSARDSAYAMLTPTQRERADSLANRELLRPRRPREPPL